MLVFAKCCKQPSKKRLGEGSLDLANMDIIRNLDETSLHRAMGKEVDWRESIRLNILKVEEVNRDNPLLLRGAENEVVAGRGCVEKGGSSFFKGGQ